ncbi:MAG: VacB/RNase II family 3'-5' exoribonuclease [Spirochaetes bacterium]|nr:VacB/RNase II family 3'-5' exoribonuclease [Spirochaetota bacterium]
MPVSSRTVIQTIQGLPQRFTRNDLLAAFTAQKPASRKRHGRKTKAGPSPKDIQRVDRTMLVLVELGFLQKGGREYRKVRFSVSGTLHVNSSGNAVCITDDDDEILVFRENLSGAMNEDIVEVRLLDIRRGRLIGAVVGVSERRRKLHLAKVIRRSGQKILCSLLDTPGRMELTAVTGTRNFPAESYVLVRTGAGGSQAPAAVEDFVSLDDEQFDFTRIRLKHSLPDDHGDYRELTDVRRKIPGEEISRRTDFRRLLTITIDGADAKDFDDAVSLKGDGTGCTLFVHIADVSHYVKAEGELDREAAARGTSYYLGERVIPMLPEILSNDLCSLREGEDRLAVTAEMRYDRYGRLLEHRFHESIIRVDRRLTYELAEEMLVMNRRDKVTSLLKVLQTLTSALKTLRMKEGRLDLNLPEEKLIFRDHRISEVRFAERLRSHMIIEECMLSANVVVSRELKEREIPAIYRIHEDIQLDSLKKLQRFLAYLHIVLPLKGNSGINLQNALAKAAGKEYEPVVNMVILKSLMQAYYGTDPIGHYGLAFEDYTHFTSPIRRYPDLIVHRCLKSLLQRREPPYGTGRLAGIAEHSSEMERVAQRAERDLVKLKSCRLMQDALGKKFQGIISGVGKFGFFVTLLDMPIEGMVPLRNLSDDYYLVMEDDYTVVGKRYGKRYRLGDKIALVLERADIEEMKIDFIPAGK